MATEEAKVPEQLKALVKCCICLKMFTDPRLLPCIHTFCLGCLDETTLKADKKPEDKIPCPVCKTQFTIPETGFGELQKNLFVERLVRMAQVSVTSGNVSCDLCSTSEAYAAEKIPFAVKYCVVCTDRLCSECAKHHQKQKVSRDHQIIDFGSEIKEENLLNKSVNEICSKHPTKPLEIYCTECFEVVCVSCFLKDHERHKGMDIREAEEEFLQDIEKGFRTLELCELGMFEKKNILQKETEAFLQQMSNIEKSVLQAGQELKELIDKQTEVLMQKASSLKSTRLEKFQAAKEQIDSYLSMLGSYKVVCDEVKAFAFPSDICRIETALRHRANKLIVRCDKLCNTNFSVAVSFKTTDTSPRVENFGRIEECEGVLHLYVIWPSDGKIVAKYIFDVTFSPPDSRTGQIPTAVQSEAATIIQEDIMFVTGIGSSSCEIWKTGGLAKPLYRNSTFYFSSAWSRCKDMSVSRNGHCIAFLSKQLYILGGYKGRKNAVLDSVEAYNPTTNNCATIGKLAHGVYYAACVACKDLIYVFGGSDSNEKAVDFVQVYNTTDNRCTVLSIPMPSPQSCMRAILHDKLVILLGSDVSFIFDLEMEMWLERVQFKTDVVHFGAALHDNRIIVFGGGKMEESDQVSFPPGMTTGMILTCKDDICYVPLLNFINDIPTEWKTLGKLPRKCLIHAHDSKTLQKVTYI